MGNGEINGQEPVFTGGIGEAPGTGNYPAGGHGPLNSTFGPAAIPCLASMYGGPPTGPGVHIHTFVGIMFNGKQIALPAGAGIANPQGLGTFAGIPNWIDFAQGPDCFYQMHVHDFSGLVHIESFTAPPGGAKGTLYTLGDFLGLWGVQVDQMNGILGPLMGNRPMLIYTSGPFARGGPGTASFLGSSTYTLFSGDINTIPLYSHEAIWILIGTGNPIGNKLPNINFFTEF